MSAERPSRFSDPPPPGRGAAPHGEDGRRAPKSLGSPPASMCELPPSRRGAEPAVAGAATGTAGISRRRQLPQPLSSPGLAALRAEAETYSTVPSRLVRRLLANHDQAVAELEELRAVASGGAVSPAEQAPRP